MRSHNNALLKSNTTHFTQQCCSEFIWLYNIGLRIDYKIKQNSSERNISITPWERQVKETTVVIVITETKTHWIGVVPLLPIVARRRRATTDVQTMF